MSVTADPLRNTLDHLSLDPNAAEDRKYLVSMLRRLGYTEREIEVYLGGDERVIEVEYRPGRTRTGTFSVVGSEQDGWVVDDHAARTGMGFSVAHGHVNGPGGDPAVEHGWIHVDPNVQGGVDFEERGAWTVGDESEIEDEWVQDDAETPWAAEPTPAPAHERGGKPTVEDEVDAWAAGETDWPDHETVEEAPVAEETAEHEWPEPESLTADETAWPEPEANVDTWAEVSEDYEIDEAPGDAWAPAETETWEPVEELDTVEAEPAAEETQWAPPEEVVEPEPAFEPEAAFEPEPAPTRPVMQDAAEAAPVDDSFTYGDYALYTRTVELSTGNEQRIFFFAKSTPKSGDPCGMPEGYQVEENRVTGLPFLRRQSPPTPDSTQETSATGTTPATSSATVTKPAQMKTAEKEVWDAPAKSSTRTTTRTTTTRTTTTSTKPTTNSAGKATTSTTVKHDPDRRRDDMQCAALTQAGSSCKNSHRAGSKYCGIHRGYRAPRN